MDTLIQEVELMSKEKEAEGAGNGLAAVAVSGGHDEPRWSAAGLTQDRPSSHRSTLSREIPVLPNKR